MAPVQQVLFITNAYHPCLFSKVTHFFWTSSRNCVGERWPTTSVASRNMFSSSVRRLVSSPSVRQFFGNRIRASDLTIGNYCSTVKVSNMTSFHDFKAKKLDGEEVRSWGHCGSYVTPLSVLSASKKPVFEPSSFFLSFYLIHFSFREVFSKPHLI